MRCSRCSTLLLAPLTCSHTQAPTTCSSCAVLCACVPVHVCLCVCLCVFTRLGQLSSAGYSLDGGAPTGPQQAQLADLVGVCRGRISGMAPKQLAEVVWALAQVGVGFWGGSGCDGDRGGECQQAA